MSNTNQTPILPTNDQVRRASDEVGQLLAAGHPTHLVAIEMATQVILLNAEVERLTHWKAEAIGVLADWEAVWEAAGRPGPLGTSKADAVRRALEDNR